MNNYLFLLIKRLRQAKLLLVRGLNVVYFLICFQLGSNLSPLSAQVPFECTGEFFLSLTDFGSSTQFYRVTIDNVTGEASFAGLPNRGNLPLNAIGYRSTDNLIYAINPINNQLVQVDATGQIFPLAVVNLDSNYGYFGADISPDGNMMILTGNNGSGTRVIAGIDLTTPTYPILFTRNLVTGGGTVNCTDIAFEPATERLFGFDSNAHRLVEIDIQTGNVDISRFPVSTVADRMGALFFNAFGELFGYGNRFTSNAATDFFQINTQTGEVTLNAVGPTAPGKDGCSCPYTFALQKTVSQSVAFPCTEVLYTFRIGNQGNDISDVNFSDLMPPELTIIEIVENPFGGNVVSGVGTNDLIIENLTILNGDNALVVRVQIDESTTGILKNQAQLTNLPAVFNEVALSDDPNTAAAFDSTTLQVIPIFVDIENQSVSTCNDESTLLSASTLGGVSFLWNDGSTDATLEIKGAGTYTVQVDSGCEIAFDTIVVTNNDLTVELGEDLEIDLGDEINLTPTLTGTGTNFTYNWVDALENSLSCLDCSIPTARPFENVTYQLVVTDENGCTASDNIQIQVNKIRDIYAATAFSPNGDGRNDLFFLQGRGNVLIRTFAIYDRWGNQVFLNTAGQLNDPTFGWNGRIESKNLNSAVFVWVAEVEFLDGVVEVISGEVNLIR